MEILDYTPVPKRFRFMTGQTWKLTFKINDVTGAVNLNNSDITAIITSPQGSKSYLTKSDGISVSNDGKFFVLKKDWTSLTTDQNDNVLMNPSLQILPKGTLTLQVFITDETGTDTTPIFMYIDVVDIPTDSSEYRMNANTTIEVTLNDGVLIGVGVQPISDRIEWRRVGFRIDVRYIGESTWTEWANFSSINKGDTGMSAYELAVQQGFVGTVSEWLTSLKVKDGRFIGLYNATTNSPALSATPAQGILDGDFYRVAVGGIIPFAGQNFTANTVCYEGDMIGKIGNQWFLLKYGYGQMMQRVTEAANSATQAAASATTATQKAAEETTQAAQALASANSAAAVAQGAVTTRVNRKPIINASFRTPFLPSEFAIVRNSPATGIASTGSRRRKSVRSNEPRFSQDGILVEYESRTNLCIYPKISQLDGYFNKPFGAVDTLDIYGEMNGSTFVPATAAIYGPSSNSTGYTIMTPIANVPDATSVTTSIYVRGIGNFYFGVTDAGGQWQQFQINSPDAYQRIEFTGMPNKDATSYRVLTLMVQKDTQPANATLSFCCPQIEVGDYATSHIRPVSGSVTTRASEILKTQTSFVPNEFGTFFIRTKKSSKLSTSTLIELKGNDTTGWNKIRVIDESNKIIFDYFKDGVESARHEVLGVVAGSILNIGVVYQKDKVKYILNGAVLGEYTVPVLSVPFTTFQVATRANTSIRDFIYFDEILADAELNSFTSLTTLFGREMNQGAALSDLGEVAFMNVKTLFSMTGRQDFTIDGTGASFTRNIRRDYDFYFVVVDSSGGTITSQPPATLCSANTDYSLIVNFPVGKAITYAIIPSFD